MGYTPRSRWPEGIESCIKCDRSYADISYGQRGLCISCVKVETLAGTLGDWDPIVRSRYSKRNKSVLYKTVINIGMTDVARRVGVEKDQVKDWLSGVEIPEVYKAVIDSLHKEIYRLSREADKGKRKEEFFKQFDTGVRYYNGKTI